MNMNKILILGFVALLAFVLLPANAASLGGGKPSIEEPFLEIPTDRLIIKYRDNVIQPGISGPASENRMRALSTTAGLEVSYVRAMSGNAHILKLRERLSASQLERIAARITAMPDVEYAEPDYILNPALAPNDTYYAMQWHYFEPYGINLPSAWDITTGSSDIRIAMLDTGITDHPDLNGRWVGGYDFISDVMMANDGNGRDSDPRDPGDWITSAESSSGYFSGCYVENSSWHGTHVAGTIGAATNNGIGVSGVNWTSQIVPVRVLGKCGGYMSDIVDGMRWAAGLTVGGVPANPHPARVLNLSLGGGGSCGTTLQNAIAAVNAAGAVIIAAAGNSNANLNTNNYVPANCSGVITVAATNRAGNRAFYSNYGSTVEISAPGGEYFPSSQYGILSTTNSGLTAPSAGTYAYYSGTSMAAPHVAGVVSLMLSVDPTLTFNQVVEILQNTARAFPTGSGCTTSTCGSGIVDAAAALSAVHTSQPLPDLIVTNVTLDPPAPRFDQSFDVLITIKNQGGATGPVTIYRDVYIGRDPLTTIDPGTGCPAAGDYYRSDFFENFAAGQSDTKTVTIPGLGQGSYQLWVYVDARCLITEIGEVDHAP